jgi:hypothetical protein
LKAFLVGKLGGVIERYLSEIKTNYVYSFSWCERVTKQRVNAKLNLYFLHVIIQYVCYILLLCWYTCNQSYIEQFFNLHISTLHPSGRIFFLVKTKQEARKTLIFMNENDNKPKKDIFGSAIVIDASTLHISSTYRYIFISQTCIADLNTLLQSENIHFINHV